MKSKLSLKTETIRTLSSAELDAVAGGLAMIPIANPYETSLSSARKPPVAQPTSSVHRPVHPPLSSVKPGPVAHPTSSAIFTFAK